MNLFHLTLFILLLFSSCKGQATIETKTGPTTLSESLHATTPPKLLKTQGYTKTDNVYCSLEDKSGHLHLKMIDCMLQDKTGNIWFASGMPPGEERVCRYDGKIDGQTQIREQYDDSIVYPRVLFYQDGFMT